MADTDVVLNGPPDVGDGKASSGGSSPHQSPVAETKQSKVKRPVDIQQDVHEMEKRKRVSLILNSQAFRQELEEIIESQIKSGPHPASLIALQQISELILPQARVPTSVLSGGGMRATGIVIPINDLRGVDAMSYSKGEKLLRCKLASLYRLVDMHGWTNLIYNHITVRISQEKEHFLINPYGMMYNELTAASLVKVDMQGQVIDPGITTFGINKGGFMLHSAVHQFRPDCRCVLHLYNEAVSAVSATKQGLMPISHEALLIGEVSYYDYRGVPVDQNERDTIARSLGPKNKVLILRNHGVLVCAGTIEEAWYLAYNTVKACEIQLKAMPAGLDNLIVLDRSALREEPREEQKGGGDTAHYKATEEKHYKWKKGELEFEALMRQMDNSGYKTGYIYHQPVVRHLPGTGKSNDEVAIPPSASGFTETAGHDDDLGILSPARRAMDRKQGEKTKWLHSPNVYTKVQVQVDQNGDGEEPKTVTRWVSEDSPSKGTIIKVDPNAFVPTGIPEEDVRTKVKVLKDKRVADKLSSGPQSNILHGMPWAATASGDQVVVHAGSKGIIQQEFQDEFVFPMLQSPNPFEKMTEKELEEYRKEVEKKQRGVGGEITTTTVETVVIDGQVKTVQKETVLTVVKSGEGEDAEIHEKLMEELRAASIKRKTPTKRHSSSSHSSQEESVVNRPAGSTEEPETKPYIQPVSEPPPEPPVKQEIKAASPKRLSPASPGSPAGSPVNGQGAPAGGSPDKAAEAGEREESSEGTPNASGKESSPTKETSPTKKKKKLRTPSFLKSKKKDKKKDKE
ncbi:alpha-adducin-like isoform X1 [Branchiostoma floridae x Branchiostoma japonicum]